MNRLSVRLLILLAAAWSTCLLAQEAPPTVDTAGPDTPAYEKVITKEARTTAGIFKVHQLKDRYYFEIPKGELGREFLWNLTIVKTVDGIGYGGDQLSYAVVRWEMKGDKVHLREVNYGLKADASKPIAQAVRAANNDSILMTFPIATVGKDGAPVIDVSRLYSSDVPEFGIRQYLGATDLDSSRTFIEHVSTFPENVDAETTMTYTRIQAGSNAPAPAYGQMRPGTSATIVVHYSMVKLPEQPMMPRLFDERVGYFTTATTDFTSDEHRARRVDYIARWRLEKKDPKAAVSEPVRPIVYYIDAATPVKWRDAVKKGVESWQKAFEAAGFRNAIIAKMVPSPSEDPTFSHEDVRHSVVRWMPSTIENAFGPHISDPRTGEILNADIRIYHNVMNMARDWYFLQAGPLDPRAQKLPLPDDVMARLVQFVVAHEVGHTLGFQHNMKASSMYDQAKVRDKDWVHQMGHTPSIMDYARFNYVAQPEDGIAVEDLVPNVGPYDVWATRWGYSPIPEAKTSEEEKPTLDLWAREQDTTPWLRFSTAGAGSADFGEQAEAVGDADAIKSTAAGLKNLQRVSKMLLAATTTKPGETYEDLGELYSRMLGQWTQEMNHVASIVGSFSTQTKYVGQQGRVYMPTPKVRQEAAVAFLTENALSTPNWAIDPEISRRIEPTGVLNRIRNAQTAMLANMLSSVRFARLVEQQAVDGPAAWAPADFLAAVRRGVWRELDSSQVKVNAYRRNVQRAWLDLANAKVNAAAGAGVSGDEPPLYRAELRTLHAQVSAAIAKSGDRETRAHLEGVRDQIIRILDPKFSNGAAGTSGGFRVSWTEDGLTGSCWRDYAIQPE